MIPSKDVLVNRMVGQQAEAYMGWVNSPAGATFKGKWADVADLLFANSIPSGASAATARAAFITAMAHADDNESLRVIIQNAFKAYLDSLNSGLDAGSFITPVAPNIAELAVLCGTMGQVEANQWMVEVISTSLVAWGKLYTMNLPAITGTTTIYKGAATAGTSTLANGLSGGSWTSSDTAVATVNSSTGVVTSVAAGTSTITYTATSQYGDSLTVTKLVTVIALPAITGGTTVAAGADLQLANAISGGSWTSATGAKATINSTTGLAHGVAAGTSVISYTMPDGGKVQMTLTVS